MTIVLVISAEDSEEIIAYSDSRVSNSTPLLDGVAKLLPLPVKIVDANQMLVLNSSFGFAFSGSTLVAQTVYSFVSASLQSLRSDDGHEVPSLEQISEYVALILKKTATELGGNVTTPSTVQTSILIFGFCPITQTRKLYKTETQITQTFEIGFGELNVVEKGTCHCIGNEEAIDMLWKEVDSNGNIDYLEALRSLIKSPDVVAVGGDIQAMIANELGASVVPILDKAKDGTVTLKLLNQVIDEVTVGPCHFKNKAISIQ